jgi:predicted RNase H-like HicB family nuclease
MKKYYYPAVFHCEDKGYSVSVPDIDGCFSEGDTFEEAYENIIDAIGLCLEEYAANKIEVPKPSKPDEIKCEAPDFMAIVECDMLAYRKKYDTKVVKKTLSIPSWLNVAAEEQHINFSGVLQEALREKLNI